MNVKFKHWFIKDSRGQLKETFLRLHLSKLCLLDKSVLLLTLHEYCFAYVKFLCYSYYAKSKEDREKLELTGFNNPSSDSGQR